MTVALPKSSPASVARQLEHLGAKVLLEGEAWDDTDCGASLSLVYEQTNNLAPFHHIVVIVCGGAKVDLGIFDKWRKEISA